MNEEKQFACDVCAKSFKQRIHMTTHRRIHSGEKPYSCDICSADFSDKGNLARHKRIHTGKKPYVCNICEKTFSDSSNLTKHKKVHSGVKCDICEITLYDSRGLAKHKRIHIGEKPYECDICSKTFPYKSELVNHERIHTGEKPYSCEVCQKSYKDRSALSKHNKTSAHLEKMDLINYVDTTTKSKTFVDCVEAIKVETIKDVMNEEKSVEESLSIHQETENSKVFRDIKEDTKGNKSVDDPSNYFYTESGVKQEIKEEVEESEEGQGVEDSNLDTDHLVDCSQFIQVQMNLTK